MYTLIDSPNSLTDDSIAHHMSKKAFHPIEKNDFLTKSIYGHMHFPGFRQLPKVLNLKNLLFKPFPAYFFVKFFKVYCCMVLYFRQNYDIILPKAYFTKEFSS